MEENGFNLDKGKKQGIPHTNNYRRGLRWWQTFLANTPAHSESLLHSLEQAAGSIGLHLNAERTEYICFDQNQKVDISALKGRSLKLIDNFTNLGRSLSSTEKEINMRQAKAWTAIDRLSVIWRSDQFDKIKRNFFPESSIVHISNGYTNWILTKRIEKKLDGNCTWMLWAVMNKSRKKHATKHQQYDHLFSHL